MGDELRERYLSEWGYYGEENMGETAYDNYAARKSRTVQKLLSHFEDGMQVVVSENTESPWIQVDVFGRYGWIRFAVWKNTDKLYPLSPDGAAGDDPITIEQAVAQVYE